MFCFRSKVYLNMTVTFGAWSKNFSDAFLKGMTNMNSSLSGVVFNITYKPGKHSFYFFGADLGILG